MSVRVNRSVQHYLQRKKILPTPDVPRPKYEMRTPHPHDRPVTPANRLRPVESPGTKVLTEER